MNLSHQLAHGTNPVLFWLAAGVITVLVFLLIPVVIRFLPNLSFPFPTKLAYIIATPIIFVLMVQFFQEMAGVPPQGRILGPRWSVYTPIMSRVPDVEKFLTEQKEPRKPFNQNHETPGQEQPPAISDEDKASGDDNHGSNGASYYQKTANGTWEAHVYPGSPLVVPIPRQVSFNINKTEGPHIPNDIRVFGGLKLNNMDDALEVVVITLVQ